MKLTLPIVIALQLAATLSLAANQSPVERGRELFNNSKLGSNGKSCSSCHPGGKDLDNAAAYDSKKLENIVNRCITNALNGTALEVGSPDLSAMVTYLKTLR